MNCENSLILARKQKRKGVPILYEVLTTALIDFLNLNYFWNSLKVCSLTGGDSENLKGVRSLALSFRSSLRKASAAEYPLGASGIANSLLLNR